MAYPQESPTAANVLEELKQVRDKVQKEDGEESVDIVAMILLVVKKDKDGALVKYRYKTLTYGPDEVKGKEATQHEIGILPRDIINFDNIHNIPIHNPKEINRNIIFCFKRTYFDNLRKSHPTSGSQRPCGRAKVAFTLSDSDNIDFEVI